MLGTFYIQYQQLLKTCGKVTDIIPIMQMRTLRLQLGKVTELVSCTATPGRGPSYVTG